MYYKGNYIGILKDRIHVDVNTCMFTFWMNVGAKRNSWSAGSFSASGFSTVKANSNFAINKKNKNG